MDLSPLTHALQQHLSELREHPDYLPGPDPELWVSQKNMTPPEIVQDLFESALGLPQLEIYVMAALDDLNQFALYAQTGCRLEDDVDREFQEASDYEPQPSDNDAYLWPGPYEDRPWQLRYC